GRADAGPKRCMSGGRRSNREARGEFGIHACRRVAGQDGTAETGWYGWSLEDLGSSAGVQIEPSAESEAVLEINPFLVAPERKRARAEVGDKRVFHFFPRPCGSERKCVRIRHTDRSARIGDAANILV